MNLPTPTAKEVKEFRTIYREEFGMDLTDHEAWEAARITLQLFYAGTYAVSLGHTKERDRIRNEASRQPDAQDMPKEG